jgi:hypothetical protein
MKEQKSTSRWPLTLPQTLAVCVISVGGGVIDNLFGFVYYLVGLAVVGLSALIIRRWNRKQNR